MDKNSQRYSEKRFVDCQRHDFWGRGQKKSLTLKSLFKVLFFCQAFVHKALRPKISTNFDDIDTLEVSKIIFVNFCIHF